MNNFSVTPFAASAVAWEAAPMTALATSGLTAREVEIFRRIHDAIFEQRLPPATRLTEEELAEMFGVSRMRVRRVLLALAHTGMIALPRGRGAVVASPSTEEARAVFAARRLIESALLEQAPRLDQGVIERLRRMIATEEAALAADDRAASIHLSGAFHIELARVCGNPVVAEIVGGLVTRSSLVIALFQRSGHLCCRADDHGRLVDRLAGSDFAGAIELMRAHLTTIESGLDLTARAGGTRNLREILAVP